MFFRLFKYAIKNILRNKFLSISSVLVLTLLMFFINILVILHNVSFKLIDSINSKLTISLYLKDGYNQNSHDIKALLSEIHKFSN
jgi:cell division protein FtsX